MVSSYAGPGPGADCVKLSGERVVVPQQLGDPGAGVVGRVLAEVGGAEWRLLRLLQLRGLSQTCQSDMNHC